MRENQNAPLFKTETRSHFRSHSRAKAPAPHFIAPAPRFVSSLLCLLSYFLLYLFVFAYSSFFSGSLGSGFSMGFRGSI